MNSNAKITALSPNKSSFTLELQNVKQQIRHFMYLNQTCIILK